MRRKKTASRGELQAAMKNYVKAVGEALHALFNAERMFRGLPPLEPDLIDIRLPRPSEFTKESIRKREIEALRRLIKRRRKLTAEDLFEIMQLRDKRGLTWSRIAKEVGTSEKAVRKAYKKAKTALATRKEPWEF
jgi:predicted DNA-binding protein (UPF0251 family)